ncbi:MAG: hypothetical protein DME50_07990 [Verrucomicrobia bacterium]|nr:MAG: hypothetical protein DME50_07990 [Verrucomicrobiota bacterium]
MVADSRGCVLRRVLLLGVLARRECKPRVAARPHVGCNYFLFFGLFSRISRSTVVGTKTGLMLDYEMVSTGHRPGSIHFLPLRLIISQPIRKIWLTF